MTDRYSVDYIEAALLDYEALKSVLGMDPDEVAANYEEFMEDVRARKRFRSQGGATA